MKRKATHVLVLQDSEMAGVLIRSGERGLLFVRSDTKQLSFIKWDQIKQVRSTPAETVIVRTSSAPAPATR